MKTAEAWRRMTGRYGITKADFLALYHQQNQRCAISGIPLGLIRGDSQGQSYAVVDHDHETGMVRGLLCPRMNIAMGIFQDSPELLRKAADYIEYHKKQHKKAKGEA